MAAVGEYAPVTSARPAAGADWRSALLADGTRIDVPAAGRDLLHWPGYTPQPAVSVWRLANGPIAAAWDFSVLGGSFGEDDATALAGAAATAVAERRPLLTLVRSGGTRLQEGMAALVGIPRARLALLGLASAGLPHLSVADAPTTGGVWVSVTSTADLRVAVDGATVGFAGPRVVEVVTGSAPPADSHTARAAFEAGLVDAVLPGDQVPGWLAAALRALIDSIPANAAPSPTLATATATASDQLTASPTPGSDHLTPATAFGGRPLPTTGGWTQVGRARARTTTGKMLLHRLFAGFVALRAPHGDLSVAAGVGRLADRPAVGVALAAELGGRPTADGYRLATRAFGLAGRLDLPVLCLVDTPGAEPGPAAERDGVAAAIGAALDALLSCPSPTLVLVHGEGGSGGALAAAAADVVLMMPDSYFAAIAPEGAQAALRRPASECADLMGITPTDLVALGIADGVVDDPLAAVGRLLDLSGEPREHRQARRKERWAAPVPGPS